MKGRAKVVMVTAYPKTSSKVKNNVSLYILNIAQVGFLIPVTYRVVEDKLPQTMRTHRPPLQWAYSQLRHSLGVLNPVQFLANTAGLCPEV